MAQRKNSMEEKSLLPAKLEQGQQEKEMVNQRMREILANNWRKKLKEIEENRKKEGDIKSIDQVKKAYFEDVANMAYIIKEFGISQVIIHGNPVYDWREKKWGWGGAFNARNKSGKKIYSEEKKEKFGPKNTPPVEIKPDFDSNGAMELLNRMSENNPAIFSEDSFIESIPKGTEKTYGGDIQKGWKVVMYVDVGNKNTGIEIDEATQTIKMYADHHGALEPYTSSSTQTIYDIAKTGNFPLVQEDLTNKNKQKEDDYIEKLVNSVNVYDNIGHFDIKKDPNNPKSLPLIDEEFLKNDYATSFYFLVKYFKYETIQKILKNDKEFSKKGKPRDLLYTFTKDEIIDGKFGDLETTEVNNEKSKKDGKIQYYSLRELVTISQDEISKSINGEVTALNRMEKNGININSPLIGPFVFHDYSTWVKDSLAYPIARGLGYPSFVRYNPKDGQIFINTNGKYDLMPIWEEFNKVVPGYPKPTRNRFMYGPKDPEMQKKVRELITKDVLLTILQGKHSNKELKNKPIEADESFDIKKMYPELDDAIWKETEEDFNNFIDDGKSLKLKENEKLNIAINSNTKESYIILKAEKGHYLLYKEKSVSPKSKKAFQFLLSNDPREEVNPELIICSEEELENWLSIKENPEEKTSKIENEIEKLRKRIQERMGNIEIESEKLNKLKDNDRRIQNELDEVNKQLKELN